MNDLHAGWSEAAAYTIQPVIVAEEAAPEPERQSRAHGSSAKWALVIYTVVTLLTLWSLRQSGGSRRWVEDVYRSVGLFTENSGWGFEHVTTDDDRSPFKHGNLLYRIMADIASVAAVAGVIELTTGRVSRGLVYFWMRIRLSLFPASGVAVIGLTEQSLHFAEDVKSTGKIAFVLTDKLDNALADRCNRAGIAVCSTHLIRPPHWVYRMLRRQPGSPYKLILNLVRDIVSFRPVIGHQMELAGDLANWQPDVGKRGVGGWAVELWSRLRQGQPTPEPIPPRLCLLTADRGLTQLLEDRLPLIADMHERPEGAAVGVQPRLLDAHTLAARQLLTRNRFDVLADAMGQNRIHLAIYGFGMLGRTIVKQAAQLYVTGPSLDGVKLHVSVLDRDGRAAIAALTAEDPGIEHVITIDVLPDTEILPGGISESQLCTIVPADVTGHILAFEDGPRALTTALSLRRWLLQPPDRLDTGWRRNHGLAPIFVAGSGQSSIDGLCRGLPDGVIGYGARHDRFAAHTILDDRRERGAMALHAAYKKKVGSDAQWSGRPAASEWAALPPAMRESNFQAYDHIPIKARAVGYRFAGLRDPHEPNAEPSTKPATILPDSVRDKLHRLEHLRYVAERQASSWRPAQRRFDPARVHPDLVGWNALSEGERTLDVAQIDTLDAIAAAATHSFAKAYTIGISGYCKPPALPDEKLVRDWLHDTLQQRRRSQAEGAVVLLTALAKGVDTWAALAARELGIPIIVPLPLPYELYRENYTAGELAPFHECIGQAEYRFELPMRFGRASELTIRHWPGEPETDPNLANRRKQYAMANAYILERADEMLYVRRDGKNWAYGENKQPITGSTDEVYGWHRNKHIPEDYRTPASFFPRRAETPAISFYEPGAALS